MQAYDQLEKAGAHIVGVVMNCCEATSSEYYYAYYTQNGKRDHTSEAAEAPLVSDSRVFAPESARKGGKHGGAAARLAQVPGVNGNRSYRG